MLDALPVLYVVTVEPCAQETDSKERLDAAEESFKIGLAEGHQTTGRSENWERLRDNCHKKKINGSISQMC